MSGVVEPGPFSEDADKLLREVLQLCVGKDVQTILNVLANAMCIVVRPAGAHEQLRQFVNDMIDVHIAEHRRREESPKS